MGRVLLLVPVTVALADSVGFHPGSRGRAGLVLATLLTNYMPSCAILPSNLPNMVLAGAAQTIFGITLTYGRYLLAHFPVLGLVKAGVIVALIWLIFREPPPNRVLGKEPPPMTREGRRMLVILLVALGFWITDFLHHISAAWVALAATVVLLLPRVGLLPLSVFSHGINFAPFFLVGAILGIGAIVGTSGLGELFARVLLEWVAPDPNAPFLTYMALSAAWTLFGVLFTIAGLPAVITPLAGDIARATGYPLETVLMTEVIGYSTVLLPYQMGPLMVGISLGGITAADGARVLLPLALLTFAVILPLNYLWWSWLGYIG